MRRRLIVREESWDTGGSFRISRSRRWAAEMLMVEIHQDGMRGRGEAVPYRRRGEKLDSVAAEIEKLRPAIETGGMTRQMLQRALPPGARPQRPGLRVLGPGGAPPRHAGVAAGRAAGTAARRHRVYDHPGQAAGDGGAGGGESPTAAAEGQAGWPDDIERVREVRSAAPDSELIVDANEAWTPVNYAEYGPALARMGVRLVEQPLPAGQEAAMIRAGRSVPVCADESVHDLKDLPAAMANFDFVNVKLDKAGGLTEALAMVQMAQDNGTGIQLGCMVGTSLGMAPAFLLAPYATIVDLDGPLLLSGDREPAIRYDDDGTMHPPPPELWGG
ncbi:MAG: dipeptide epimerase [Proteobacteria bacterium]|nr:dipeptide epimerase [Pseudomonadota bacterium]